MAGVARAWSPDTPRRRARRATLREVPVLLAWLVAVVVVAVVVDRWAGVALLFVGVGVSTVRVARTGATGAMRRAGIRYVRLGTGADPEPWRLALHRAGPVLVLGGVLALSRTGSGAFFVVFLAYMALIVVGSVKAARHGPDLEPMLALAGLDVWWAGDPPTPPAPGPAPDGPSA